MRRQRGQVNVPIAVASLTISLMLFFIVMPNWMSKRPRKLHVQLKPVPYGFDSKRFYIQKMPDVVEVTANLSDEEYNNLSSVATAEANLSDAKAGTASYPVSLYPEKLRKVVQDQDPHATYTLEEVRTREVKVDVVQTGKLADPTEFLDQLTPDLKKVTVEGPEQDVMRVVRARATVRLDALDKTATQINSVVLEPVDANDSVVERVDVHPTQISIATKFSIAPEEKVLFVQAVFDSTKLPVGYSIRDYSVVPQSVTATGSSASLGKISSVKTEKIDLSKLTGSQTLIIPLKPLGGNIKLRPAAVGVTVNLQPITFNSLSPKFRSNRTNESPSAPGAPK